ncbi:MAG: adenine deaminase C-terminal domain-containing protein [Chitinophagaceae bacterium]
MSSFSISGNLVDVHQQRIYPATITVENGKILSIQESSHSPFSASHYLLPGFIDSHVHIESSMLVPSEFARLAVVHGTVATVSDPHEIANVCGMEGVEFMIENGKTVPFKFNFGAPSCVPATIFETAGATFDSTDVEKLLQRDEIKYLSEMMNFPGVLFKDEEVMKKIAAAHRLGKPVDGHAPGLRGEKAREYIQAPLPSEGKAPLPPEGGFSESGIAEVVLDLSGSEAPPSEGFGEARISTDHECFTAEEALDKLQYGMKIIIREGSAAKNFEALIGLLNDHPGMMMFCSDDKHPDSLVLGHINQLCARAAAKGIDLFKILKAACVNPVNHYKLDVGLLREGDAADFIVVKDLEHFEVVKTFIDGELVAENGVSNINTTKSGTVNNFSCTKKETADFEVTWKNEKEIPIIEALDGQLITNRLPFVPKVTDGKIVSDTDRDILKIVVVNRYSNAPAARAFIKNFGLQKGAIASSVAHDSHNIVAVGVDDESICAAVNLVIEHKGGVSFSGDDLEMIVPLPVAGLMSNEDGYKIAEQYSLIDKAAKDAGSTLGSPFMTLSFMALLVIPHLKLSDKGLFDGDRFELIK